MNKDHTIDILSNVKGCQKDFIHSMNYIFDNLNKNIEVLNNQKINGQSKYNDLAIKCNEFIEYLSIQKDFIYGRILLSINNHNVEFDRILFYLQILKHYCYYIANFNNSNIIIKKNYNDFIDNFFNKNFNDKKKYNWEKTMNFLLSIIKIWNHLFDDDIPYNIYKEHVLCFIKDDNQNNNNNNNKKIQKELDKQLVKNFKQCIIKKIKEFFDSECIKKYSILNNTAEYLNKRLKSIKSDKIKNAAIEGIQESLLKELELYYKNNYYEIYDDELQKYLPSILESLSNNSKFITLLIQNNIENCFNNNISLEFNGKKFEGKVFKNDLDNNILQCNAIIHNKIFNLSIANYYIYIKSLWPFFKYINNKKKKSCFIDYCCKLIRKFIVLQNIQEYIIGKTSSSNAHNILSNEKKYIDRYFKEKDSNEISQWFADLLKKLRMSNTYFDLLDILENTIKITIEDAFDLLFTMQIELYPNKELFNEILDNMIIYYNPNDYRFKNIVNYNKNVYNIEGEDNNNSHKTMDDINFPTKKEDENIKNDIVDPNNNQIENNIPIMWMKILKNNSQSCKEINDINSQMTEQYTNIKNNIANFNNDQIKNSMLPMLIKILFLYYNMCLLITFSIAELMAHNEEIENYINAFGSIANENFISNLYDKGQTIEYLVFNSCQIMNRLKTAIENKLYNSHVINSEKLFLNNLYELFFCFNEDHKNFQTFLEINNIDIYKEITNPEEESSFIYKYILLLNNIIKIEQNTINKIYDEINRISHKTINSKIDEIDSEIDEINSEIDEIDKNNNKNIDPNIK